jgi:hypothetical protein
MKKLLYVGLALLTFALHGCGPTSIVVQSTPAEPPPPPPAPEGSYQSFYDALSPYGQWINNPDYGYVWMPSVAPDFTPYGSNGHWVYTDEGWTWDSDYPWGWAAFHYGRWFFEDGYGWMWIPGNEWAPAWVTWRQSPDYYGWAPLGPQVSISASYGGSYNPPPHYWHFVPQQYVARPQVNNYFVSEQQNVTIVHNTTIIRNTTINNTTIVNNNVNNRGTRNNYAGGPDPAEVSRVSGAPLRPVPLRESNRPGENSAGGAFSIYRPRINQPSPSGGGGSSAAAPSRVQPLNQVRPVNPTSYNNQRPANNPSSNTNPGTPAPNGGNPAFNGNSNFNNNRPTNDRGNNGNNGNQANQGNQGNANNNGNPNNAGNPANNGNPNNNGNPANTGNPSNAGNPRNGNNPNSNGNPNNGNPNNNGNPGAPRSVNNPATAPVRGTPGNTTPGNTAPGNTSPANHPIFARPGSGNPQVRTQPGGGKPQPTVTQPPTNNHPAPPKTTTPAARPLNQSPAGNKPKTDDKDNKDNRPKPQQ